MPTWPDWWEWTLEFSPHLLKRMVDRNFNETDLRDMLDIASGYEIDAEPGRYRILTTRGTKPWAVIVEPDESAQLLVVITAFPT